MAKFLHANEERVRVRVKDGIIIDITDEQLIIKVPKGEFRGTKRPYIDDILIMSEALKRIFPPIQYLTASIICPTPVEGDDNIIY